MSELSLRTTLEPFGPACAIILTDDQVRELGGGKRAAVRVSIDGRTTALRLAVMGGVNCIGLSKAARAELGVEIGQQVDAVVALDETPREVEIPAELAEALSGDPDAARRFEALAYTHRKSFATWVGEAKKAETRLRRAAEAITMIHEGRMR